MNNERLKIDVWLFARCLMGCRFLLYTKHNRKIFLLSRGDRSSAVGWPKALKKIALMCLEDVAPFLEKNRYRTPKSGAKGHGNGKKRRQTTESDFDVSFIEPFVDSKQNSKFMLSMNANFSPPTP